MPECLTYRPPIHPSATKAERHCRLVLEDDSLPEQIRGVVLEGMVNLLEHHTRAKLAPRQADAMQLHKMLVMHK